MRRVVLSLLLAALAAGCATVSDEPEYAAVDGLDYPNAVVLRLQVTDVEYTDYVPAANAQCSEAGACIQMSFWYKYKARVLRVVRGRWSGNSIEFANLQHAQYVDRLTNDCYVVLHEAAPSLAENLGVNYVAEDFVFPGRKSDRARLRVLLNGT